MKWPWEYLFDHIYGRYVALLKKYNELKNATVYMGKFDDEQPTQADKPSAHSSLTRSEARKKLEKAFGGSDYKIFNVANTNSMEPFIDANSVVVVEEINPDILDKQPIVRGDICIYIRPIPGTNGSIQMVIHRVKSVNTFGDKFYFKGDNNFFADGWVDIDFIKYRYIGQIQTQQLEPGD